MLKEINILPECELFYRFKRKESLSLSFSNGLNVLIGKNGCGKSTFFKVLRDCLLEAKTDGVKLKLDRSLLSKPVYFIASEENNPRLNLLNISPFDRQSTHKVVFWMNRSELSNGQNTFAMLRDVASFANNGSMVVFDEPEKALDASSLIAFKKNVKELSKDVQVIIITHHPALILDEKFVDSVVEFGDDKSYLDDVKKLLKF